MSKAALRKALITLFGGRGKVPKPDDLDEVAGILFHNICEAVKDEGGEEQHITKKDLYAYLVMQSTSGISQKTVDALFEKVDLNGDGMLDQAEFNQVLHRCYDVLTRELEWDERMMNSAVPYNHCIPGSAKMNARAGVNSFGMKVVRRRSMERLWEVFRSVDQDSDGYISLPEFKRYTKLHQQHVSSMSTSIFYSLDKNRNGLLTFKELLKCFYPEASEHDLKILLRMARPQDLSTQSRPDEEMMTDIKNIFMIYDDDKSGSLDMEEFVHAMGLIGFDEAEATKMFKEVDKDGSGEISYSEFEQWYIMAHKRHTRPADEAEDEKSDEDE